MNIDEAFRSRLLATFRLLDNVPASRTLPAPATLATTIGRTAESAKKDGPARRVPPATAASFGTAAVEIWLRGVHSFLISSSLTAASPVWAAVSGYYSSHYSIRGIAHLLGYFYLFNRGMVTRLEVGPYNGYSCSFLSKPKGTSAGSEHLIYWTLVKRDGIFVDDPLFTENLQKQDVDESDVGHRNFANYIDHIGRYPTFHPLDENTMKNRINFLSNIALTDIPIPRRSKFPDTETVQLIAYHRLVSFRKILDEILGNSNRFWNVHRNPTFATNFLDFQLAERVNVSQPN